MGFFDTRRGKVSVGLAILSGGGLLITQAQMHIKDPNLNSALQFLLVFWVIFTAKLTYTFGWQQEAAGDQRPTGVPLAVKGAAKASPAKKAAPKAAAQEKDSGDEGDSEGSEDASGKPRRRRTRRD